MIKRVTRSVCPSEIKDFEMKRSGFIFLSACLLFSGCATNYKLEAVKDARLYALEKFPDLSERSIHQIKFTVPKIQQEVIFLQENTGSKRDFTQTCVVWNLDDFDGKSLVIAGFGQKDLSDWYPIRAILRRYRTIDDGKKKKKSGGTKTIRDLKKRKKKRRWERASK